VPPAAPAIKIDEVASRFSHRNDFVFISNRALHWLNIIVIVAAVFLALNLCLKATTCSTCQVGERALPIF
jgi:hypothetical protein